ncbi:hypothetical protein M3E13_11460 [Oceanobacillus kimchii]|uniref:hypothetical protein n=1 Tax=Oceanobacillus kimchii TaxID=746691 RepID=UPI0021A581C0|nr:hypothetical protein [Oceanobacillus kimchii]MCT1577534.1 hypothetical protein [Oceanobacillus kimchii]MCT2136522.1 hypothetical protein [Oceanobacillus kimchii]
MCMKVEEIKKQLDELGVEYDSKLNKDGLLELLETHSASDKEEDIAVAPTKKYIVVEDFKDLEDNDFIYTKDDLYPREENKNVDEKRIKELSSIKNKRNRVLIREQD